MNDFTTIIIIPYARLIGKSSVFQLKKCFSTPKLIDILNIIKYEV